MNFEMILKKYYHFLISNMPVYYLICGYRGTGKDTLYKSFIGDKTFSWKKFQYKNIPSNFILTDNYNPIDKESPNSKLVRFGFADSLKLEVLKILGLPFFNHELYKDKTLFEIEEVLKYKIPYSIDKNKTLRDLYILFGTSERLKNQYHWCEKVYQQIKDEDFVVITDFRYPNEKDFFLDKGEVITIRVFRKDVIPAGLEVENEHLLDTFKTDLVYLPEQNWEEEYEGLLKAFPQYK